MKYVDRRRDRFDSGEDDFFNSQRGREGRQWQREEDITGIPHDPNWGHRAESLINDNYEARPRRGGRRPPYDDAIDLERRPPPRRRDGPNRMPPPPRGRGGMPAEFMDDMQPFDVDGMYDDDFGGPPRDFY
mmetsp:Transcript_13412/g.19911  ORF Transcript_13412/g.19911 Transcript_13412/m.19911 type:complete len:131 (-) Transcript_13412:81-473(-)